MSVGRSAARAGAGGHNETWLRSTMGHAHTTDKAGRCATVLLHKETMKTRVLIGRQFYNTNDGFRMYACAHQSSRAGGRPAPRALKRNGPHRSNGARPPPGRCRLLGATGAGQDPAQPDGWPPARPPACLGVAAGQASPSFEQAGPGACHSPAAPSQAHASPATRGVLSCAELRGPQARTPARRFEARRAEGG